MKHIIPIAVLAILTVTLFVKVVGAPSATIPTGVIQITIANQACQTLSPEMGYNAARYQSARNNDSLDDFEEVALSEGCYIQATTVGPGGMRLTDIPLLLLRHEAPLGSPEVFGGPRRTDAYGTAAWFFRPTPNTHFIYEVVSPNPTRRTVISNPIQIQLCTGENSGQAGAGFDRSDSGRGCNK